MKLTSPVAHEAFGPLSLKWHRHMGRTPTWKDETELVALLKAGVVAHGVVTALIGILFVQAAWVVLVKIGPKRWDRYGLKSWIEAAKKRLHHNVLAVALANKLARIAWAVLHKGRAFECVKTNEAAYQPA